MNAPSDPPSTSSHISQLEAAVEQIREQGWKSHQAGHLGLHTAKLLSESTDQFLLSLWETRLASCSEETKQKIKAHSVLVAVGGSGREELAPYSDTDLLMLFDPRIKKTVEPVYSSFIRDGWDSGLKIGSNFSPINQTIDLCREEIKTASSVAEARRLLGSETFFNRFKKRFYDKVIKSRKKHYVNNCVQSRLSEQKELGSTVKHLQPNIKKSKGGLRDLHLLQWIAYAFYQTTNLNKLNLLGVITKEDFRILRDAHEFLTRIRIDMHYHSQRAQDVLSAHEQLRLAKVWGFEDNEVQRDVEQFMQIYFQHTTALADVVDRFVTNHQIQSKVKNVASSLTNIRVDKNFVMGSNHLLVPKKSKPLLYNRLEHVLRLYRSVASHQKLPSPQTTQHLLEASKSITAIPTQKEAEIFMTLLNTVGFLSQTIRHMFRTEFLDHVIPEFTHVRCLIQYNNYHSFTVDEHTFRALQAAEENLTEESTAGVAYAHLSDKALLHLAVMVHDLGKGYPEDHSEVGRRMAADIADRLFLSQERKETLMFLVLHHLTMADCAFRRDTTDPKVLYELAELIGTPQKLRLMYLLTIADLKGVGPGIWNDWKEELLTGLYDRLMILLSGKQSQHGEEKRREQLKTQILKQYLQIEGGVRNTSAQARWVLDQVDQLPSHYWQNTPTEQIVADLVEISQLDDGEIKISGHYVPQTNTVEYRIVTQSKQAEGLFHRTVGVLTAWHQAILSAKIITTFEGYVIDTFQVEDPDFDEAVPETRMEELIAAIRKGIANRKSLKPVFQKHMRFTTSEAAPVSNEPFRIQVDNESASHCTIISIFAHDRRGLLYTIARCLDDLELPVMVAMIATNVDQVADVFYVVNKSGSKITDESELRRIDEYLKSEIREFNQEGYLQFRS